MRLIFSPQSGQAYLLSSVEDESAVLVRANYRACLDLNQQPIIYQCANLYARGGRPYFTEEFAVHLCNLHHVLPISDKNPSADNIRHSASCLFYGTLDFLKDVLCLGDYIPLAKEISLRIHGSSSGDLYELAYPDRT